MKLNKIETFKLQLKPYDFYKKIDELQELTEKERFYLKNFGIYNNAVRPETWMLRIRLEGGRRKIEDFEAILQEAKKYNASLLLTARAQIELHSLTFHDVLAMHTSLEAKGVTTFQTLTDNIRNIVTDPLDGVGEETFCEVYPLIVKMQKVFLKNPRFLGMLPRKFNTAISASQRFSFFGNDCYFALAKKENQFGFNLYLGGKNDQVAQDANIFVSPQEVVDLFYAVIEAYRAFGLRESRNRARLFHLLQEIGIERFKKYMQKFYPKKFTPAGELLLKKDESEDDFFPLKNRRYAYRLRTHFGEIEKEQFEEVIHFAKREGLELRIGVDQNLYIIGLKQKSVPFKALSNNAHILVCAGSRYCVYSLFDTKQEVDRLILEELGKYHIKVGYSGCLKGCGRHSFSDIGFVGIRTNRYGKLERGVRLFLGGEYTFGKRVARQIYWAIPLRKLNDILRVIIEEFQKSGYGDFEQFSQNVLNQYSEEFLAFWFLAKLYTKKRAFLDGNEAELKLLFKDEKFYDKEYVKMIQFLQHSLFS